MTWNRLRQQQQRGAQLDARSGAGKAPAEAVADRSAQDHEHAAGSPQPGDDYPASRIEDRDQDNTPTAPEPDVEWDEVVQPEGRTDNRGDSGRDAPGETLPLPEGK